MSDVEHEQEEEAPSDLSSGRIIDKYIAASEIVNHALQVVIDKCLPGVDIAELCNIGDEAITTKVANSFKQKEKDRKVEKGIAFPTCISVNECCGNYSPLLSESRPLEAGDVAKIDLGCHIDGFVCVGAHTIVVGVTEITGRKADVLMACWTAAECALRAIYPGNRNTNVTDVIMKSAAEFHCNPVQGVLSHQMKQYVIDGNRVIMGKQTSSEKADEFEFAMNEVYGIDILLSTGEGKSRENPERTTVYKRNPEKKYLLKTKHAREFIGEVEKRYFSLPFSLRNFKEVTARVGVQQSNEHELLIPYPPLYEKSNEFVAQIKFTVLLLPGGTKKVTGLTFSQRDKVVSEYEVKDPELLALLALSADPKIRKKKEKKALKEQLAAVQAADVE